MEYLAYIAVLYIMLMLDLLAFAVIPDKDRPAPAYAYLPGGALLWHLANAVKRL